MTVFDGIVLAGGRSERMGADKALIKLEGRTFLERTLDALAPARSVVVVGPPKDTTRSVVWTREEPPGSGPVAGIAAALEFVTAPAVVVLPVDLPGINGASVARLVEAMHRDGSALVDDDGSRQLPAGAYRTDALREAVLNAGRLAGVPLRSLVGRLQLVEVSDPLAVDCDTPQDVEFVETLLRNRERRDENA
jgi:molybdopterin-guanine dinucleotide biosynthesis protein A